MGKKNRRNRRKQRFLEKKSSPYINKYNDNNINSHKKKKSFSPATAVYDTKSGDFASVSSKFSPIKEKGNVSPPNIADGLPILAEKVAEFKKQFGL